MKALFIHHSTGANLIREGRLRDLLKGTSIELWDHGYNLYKFFPKFLAKYTYHTGLSNNTGKIVGVDYNIFLSNNSPKEYAEIFSRDREDPTLREILRHDLIAFKNCFPTTKIESIGQLEEYKSYYQTIIASLAEYSSHTFILITPPPLRRELTTSTNARRAQQLVYWLQQQLLPNNVNIFNLFNELADENGYLRKIYTRRAQWDSHPNKKANQEVAPIFAAKLKSAI